MSRAERRAPAIGRPLLVAFAAGVLLAGCEERDVILEGPRYEVRTPLESSLPGAEPLPSEATRTSVPIRLPSQVNHQSWPHPGGSVQHRIQHPSLGGALRPVWATQIGTGEDRRYRIGTSPVAGNGRIFTMDSRATVTAVSLSSGQVIWSADLTPPSDSPDDASGGGLSLAGDTLYATSAFGTLTALDAATGGVRWTHDFNVSITAPATATGNLVYAVTRDSAAWALDARNGRIIWTVPGTPSLSGLSGRASPALTDRLVLFPLASGELIGTLRQSGIQVWGDTISGTRRGFSYTGFGDISGSPVVLGERAYVGTPIGRVVALDHRNGERIWTADEGTNGTPWVSGGAVFLVSDQNRLVRLDSQTGATVWSLPMPYFAERRERRQRALIAHFGPVLAGGRLLVASNDGILRGYDPASGGLIETVELPSGAATPPIVVNGTLYVVTSDGQLRAYR